jgi:hypothetical protein
MKNRNVRDVARRIVLLVLATLACGATGCQASTPSALRTDREFPATQLTGLSVPQPFAPVEAIVTPPLGWRTEPLKSSPRHNHQVWISPSGNTAYGVIRFKLPMPIGPEMFLHLGFLPQMKKTEGEAHLVSSQRDPSLPGLRFVADGGLYRLRTNLITRGSKGWAVYAGTLRAKDIVPDELVLAELAREHTALEPAALGSAARTPRR